METIWKTILGIFIVIMILFISLGVIGATNDASAADAYLQKCSAEMQVCNFNESVINGFIEEAEKNGYVLTVTTQKDARGDVLYAVMELEYTYSIPLIGLESTHTKSIVSK